MENKKIYIFIGPPFSGKETQTEKLSEKIGIPVFSMGDLIRKAKEEKNPVMMEAYEKYSMKGLHVPTDIKFRLLKAKMDSARDGFILDNFPATEDDLGALVEYLIENKLFVSKAFYLSIDEDEMKTRFDANPNRGRADDTIKNIESRRRQQDKDRKIVLDYFKEEGILVRIDGEQSIEEVSSEIGKHL